MCFVDAGVDEVGVGSCASSLVIDVVCIVGSRMRDATESPRSVAFGGEGGGVPDPVSLYRGDLYAISESRPSNAYRG